MNVLVRIVLTRKSCFKLLNPLLNIKKSTLDISPHIDTETFLNELGTLF